MVEFVQKPRYTAQDLVRIVALLRQPEGGCPWDKAQTHASIRQNFIEETYEAVEAIDLGDPELFAGRAGRRAAAGGAALPDGSRAGRL